jgi:adenosylhomocysteine nucleosidase
LAEDSNILICFAVPEEAGPFRRRGLLGVDILVTGMGRENARREFLARLAVSVPKLVLTCGFAGGLDPALKPEAVIFSTEDEGGLKAGLVHAGALPVQFHCSDRVATTAAEKEALRKATGKDAVEMESEVIRSLCREKRIPSATVRVISDAADEELPLDFNELMTPDYRLSFAKLAGKLICSPGKIPALMRLQKRTTSSAERLAAVLEALLRGRVGGN